MPATQKAGASRTATDPLGVILGAPLAVVLYVFVKQFYVRDALGHGTDVPGEGKQQKETKS